MATIHELEQECRLISTQVEMGIQWVNKFDVVPSENKEALIYNLKKQRRLVHKYQSSLVKRPSVALFGESQVGKSYLVSQLAKTPEQDSFNICMPDGKEVDFVVGINPPGGGKEATGVITRFTCDPAFSGKLRIFLLSQADILKIILNGYFSDINSHDYKINRPEIQQKIRFLTTKQNAQLQTGFSEDDIYDVREYLLLNFKSNAIVSELEDIHFWEEISGIIPYLANDIRHQLFELVWGKHDFFTSIYKQLADALQRMNFPDVIEVRKDAMTPNTQTILDVERLRELECQPKIRNSVYKDERSTNIQVGSAEDLVEVITPGGASIQLHRSLIAAVATEAVVSIPIATSQHPDRLFLQGADILDFPGARSRLKMAEDTFKQKPFEDKIMLFLRGKIAYLFERYNSNFEISTLLFCMHDLQSNVQDLPRIIHDWIKNMHGDTVQKREDRENELMALVPQGNVKRRINPMFLALTKFNIEIQGKASEIIGEPKTHNGKWDARLKANFNEFMKSPVSDNWPNEWSKTEPAFQNVFMIRDPKYSRAVFDGIDKNNKGKETSVKPDYVEKLQDMKISFMNHEYVNKHFRDKVRAWDESTLPTKSGVDYLVEHLTPCAHPIIRTTQLAFTIRQIKMVTYQLLEPYYEGGDIAKKLEEAAKKAQKVFMNLSNWNTKTNGLGKLLEKLLLNEAEAWNIYSDFIMPSEHKKQEAPTDGKRQNQLITLWQTFGAFIDLDENAPIKENLDKIKEFNGCADEESFKSLLKDSGIDYDLLIKPLPTKGELLASMLITNWLQKVIALANNPDLQQMNLSKEILLLLIETYNQSWERVKLKDKMAQKLNSLVVNYSVVNPNNDLVAHLSSALVNEYVTTLGWVLIDDKESADYPKIKGIPIFTQSSQQPVAKQNLQITVSYPGLALFAQWLTGIKDSYKANVLFKHNVKKTMNLAANMELGGVLDTLKV